MAQIVNIALTILGFSMAIINYIEGNFLMVIVSLIYAPIFFILFFITRYTKNIKIFLYVSLTLSFFMEIVYLITGGQEGFGIYWMLIITMFSFFISDNKPFFYINFFYFLLIVIAFWTPLSKFCFNYSPFIRVRFPCLYLIEIIFASFFKFKLSKTEKSRKKYIQKLYTLQNSLSSQVQIRTKQLEEEKNFSNNLLIEVTQALATTIDAKDKYTSGHSRRVAEYSKKLAKMMDLDEQNQQKIYLIALLHDIGKIGIPDDIINKRDALTEKEYQKIKEHPKIGDEILQNIKTMPDFQIGARWHHERFDGKGYPDNLKDDKIPLFVQIISVADSYDAMTSNRSYRSYLPQEKVRSELEKGKNKQFNPEIAQKMIDLIDLDTDYKMHE